MRNRKKSRLAFTLIEITIVVMVLGILLMIAIPGWIQARQSSRVKVVCENLKRIDDAKQHWAMSFGKDSSDTPAVSDLVPTFLNKWPVGPVGAATDYVPNSVAGDATFKGYATSDFTQTDPSAAITGAGL